MQDSESEKAKAFIEVANTFDDHVFGISSNDDVFTEYGVEDNTVVLYKKVIIILSLNLYR